MMPRTSGAKMERAEAPSGSSEVMVSRVTLPARARAATASSNAGGSPTALPCTMNAPSGIMAAA